MIAGTWLVLALLGRPIRAHRWPSPSGSSRRGSTPNATWHIAACVDMLRCMRTTVELNDELVRKAKKRAADEGTTFREVLERALRAHLEPRRGGGRAYKLALKVHGGGLQAGVSLEDWNALRDRMDGS